MEAENELIVAWQQTGCVKSRDSVIASHTGAVLFRAYRVPTPGGIEREDLINEGFLGMTEALDKFDTTRGVKFLSYGLTAAINAMFDYVDKNSNHGISYYGKSNGIEKLVRCVGHLKEGSHKAMEEFSLERDIPMSDLLAYMRSRVTSDEIEHSSSPHAFLENLEKEDVLRKAVALLETRCDKYERAAILSQITEDYTIGEIADSVGRTRQGLRNTYARTIGYLQEKLV